MASKSPDEGLPANEGGGQHADLPSRPGDTGQLAHAEARAELRDRETYYAELRFAVHCQNRSIPAPRLARDDDEGSIWRHGDGGAEGESWDEMIARFGDTWT